MTLSGKVVLLTGGTSGIGKVAARELARREATVVVVGRDRARCEQTVAELRAETGSECVSFLEGDLSAQAEVRRVAAEFLDRYDRLDVLAHNAGAIFGERRLSADGIEMTFALNHLAPFLLTHLLLDVLKGTSRSRVVNVSSEAHRFGQIDFDDLQGVQRFNPVRAYAQSKLANVMFTYELARRVYDAGVTANALHPGFVASRFAGELTGVLGLFFRLSRPFALSPERGADTLIYLAGSDEVEGVTGKYFVRRRPRRTAPATYDPAVVTRLWRVSEEMTGI
jgi:NAD(P)-dependent dehydrogenase (short-subunit alcohol dehydrogenase family)